MKNFKFLSSLALSGMLATTIMGSTFAANMDTTALGKYKKLIDGKNVVPYILASEDDRLTLGEIKTKGQFNSITLYNNSAVDIKDEREARTGDTFKADGTEYTVVIYGDVATDGAVDVEDAALVLQMAVGNAEGISKAQEEAADVVNDGEVDVEDAARILKFAVGNLDETLVNPLPEEEKEAKSKYAVSLNIKYINNQQPTAEAPVKVVIDLEKALTETLKDVQVIYQDGEKDAVEITDVFDIEDHKTQDTQEIINYNVFNTLKHGDNTLKLVAKAGKYRKEDEVLATFIVKKHDTAPGAINVTTERTGSATAKMALEGYSTDADAQVVKMYYTYDGSNPTTKSASKTLTSNKLAATEIATNLKKDETYTVKFITEDQYGNLSTEPMEVVIAKDSDDVKAEKAVKKVNVPTLDGTKDHADEFYWEEVAGVRSSKGHAIGGYEVTLYKDGKVVYQNTQKTTTFSIKDYISDASGAGKYKLSVKVKGNEKGETTDSKVVTSDEIEIKKLDAVKNIAVEPNEETPTRATVTWESNYVADKNTGNNISGYEVVLSEYNTKTKKYEAVKTINNITTKKVELTDLTPNLDYSVSVKVVRKADDLTKVNSDATEKRFFTINADMISIVKPSKDIPAPTKTKSITVHVDESKLKFEGKKATYTVEIFQEVKGSEDYDVRGYEKIGTQAITLDKNGNAEITKGLIPGTNYKFKLIVEVEGVTGKSTYTDEIEKTKLDGTEIKNLTIAEKAGDKKIALSTEENKEGLNINNKLYLAGENGKFDAYYPNAGLAEVYTIMKANGVLKTDDVITYENSKLTVELPSKASDRNFGDTLKDMTLELKGNNFSKKIEGTVKKLVLTGNAIYDIETIESDNIVLNNGVSVTTKAAKTVTIAANSTATINGVKATTVKETKLGVTVNSGDATISVTPNNASNDLTFECEKGATIVFTETDEGYGSSQSGKITVKAGGTVSVKGNGMSVNSTIEVEVSGEADVNLQDPTLKGSQNVKVSLGKDETTTIRVKAAVKAPINMSHVELKDYSDEELLKVANVTEDNIAKVRNYINSFNLNGKGAYITASTETENVEITFTEAVSNAEISNLK